MSGGGWRRVFPDLRQLLDTIAAELGRFHVPGLELAVVHDGEVVFSGGLGVRGVDDATAVGAQTLFHHGSCGKAFTGLLASLVAADGLLDLDAPVRHYVPQLALPDPVIAERVTTRDLLAHRSGLGRHDLTWIFNGDWSRAECIRRMQHLPLVGDLRAQWSYSNFGFMLAGVVVERVTGHSWEEQVKTRIFEPLGMSRSSPTEATLTSDGNSATPHVVRDGKPVVTDVRITPAIAPAGGIVSCADDATRWLLAQLGTSDLAADVVARCHELQVPIPAGAMPLPEITLHGYGLGWVEGAYRGRPVAWHSGGVDGFLTQTLLLPQQKFGVVACANAHMSQLPLAVVFHVADAVLGEGGEQPWFDRLRADTAEAENATASSPSEEQAVVVAPRPAVHPLDAYVGTFSDAGYGDFVVGRDGDGLSFRFGSTDVVGSHRHLDTWDLRYAPLEADGTASFNTAADGKVAEVVVAFEAVGDSVRFARTAD
jgi:CubicO group peptidase (beta-lactamase class C family)